MRNVIDIEEARNAPTVPAPAHTLDSLAAGLHDLTTDVRRIRALVEKIAAKLGVEE